MYKVKLTTKAEKDLKTLKISEYDAFKKAQELISELQLHPYIGKGKPERLRYDYSGYYSRRITRKHRLVYSIEDKEITVLVVSAMGHYGDR